MFGHSQVHSKLIVDCAHKKSANLLKGRQCDAAAVLFVLPFSRLLSVAVNFPSAASNSSTVQISLASGGFFWAYARAQNIQNRTYSPRKTCASSCKDKLGVKFTELSTTHLDPMAAVQKCRSPAQTLQCQFLSLLQLLLSVPSVGTPNEEHQVSENF